MTVSTSSLIIGGDGQLGRELASRLRESGDRVVVTTRRVDTLGENRVFLDLATIRSDDIPCADVAFLCAGATSLDYCHQHPAAARRVNVEGTIALAKTLVRQGSFVVFLSTNLVFDGTIPHVRADVERRPTTTYGFQKAEAERQLLELSDRVAVIRLSKVLPLDYPLFRSWHQQLIERQRIRAFTDMSIAPIPVNFAVELIERIGGGRLSGIWQASAREEISYYEIAKRLAQRGKADGELVCGVSAATFGPLHGVTPKHSTLDSDRLDTELGLGVPHAWSTVERTLADTVDRGRDE